MKLTEKYRPTALQAVVGQPKAVAVVSRFMDRGLGGNAFWVCDAVRVLDCLNAHDELVEAAGEGRDALRDIINAADNGEAYTPQELAREYGEIVEQLRSAIAKAKQ